MKYKIKNKYLTLFETMECMGICALENIDLKKDFCFLEKWIQDGKNGMMTFMEKNWHVRQNPTHILPNAKTALIFLFPYSHGHKVRNQNGIDQIQYPKQSLIGKKLISKYVYSKDYHKIIKKNLLKYAQTLQDHIGQAFAYRPLVDSVPFFERAYGRNGGLGFIGKNTMLIRPGMGSFFFIGTLLTDLDISVLAEKDDKKHAIFDLDCRDCTRCLDACPTQAIEKNYTLNAAKCLSYFTIEHRDIVPKQLIKHFDKTLYGCDICQDVCPYNFVTQNISMLNEFKQIHDPFLALKAEDLAMMTETQYQQWFGGTAMTRARYEGLVRNALYHLYAIHDEKLNDILVALKNSKYSLIHRTVEQIILERDSHDK